MKKEIKYYTVPKWEEIKDRIPRLENGRLDVEKYRKSDLHKEYARNVAIYLPEYDQIALREDIFKKHILDYPNYINGENGKNHQTELEKLTKEFYSRHPELQGQSPYQD